MIIKFDISLFIILVQFVIILLLLNKEKIIEWRRLKKIKMSGDYGEKLVQEYIDDLEDVFAIFHGLAGKFQGQRYEIDHLLLTHQGIILIETKNIRGRIVAKKDSWAQVKKSGSGNQYEREFKSPVNQVDRTARIFDSFISEKGFRAKVVPLIVFSNRDCDLKLGNQKFPVLKLHQVEDYINNLSRDVPLSTRQLRQLQTIIQENFTI
jgi:hypothetical protein